MLVISSDHKKRERTAMKCEIGRLMGKLDIAHPRILWFCTGKERKAAASPGHRPLERPENEGTESVGKNVPSKIMAECGLSGALNLS